MIDLTEKEPVLITTWPVVRKLLVETTERLTGYERGRVLVETKTDRRPADGNPYVTIWFKSLEPLSVNEGNVYIDEEEQHQVIDNESFCTVQFNFWGDDAYTEALKFMQSLHARQREFDLWQILGFSGIDSVQDISQQYGGKIQQRAFFNLSFYVLLGRVFPVEWFNISQWIIETQNHAEQWELKKGDRENDKSGCLP